MPIVRINVRKSRSAEEKSQFCDAVYSALRKALKIPGGGRQLFYVEHAPENFQIPLGRSDDYTIIEITLFAGRSFEAKKKLYQLITQKLGALGIASNDILVVLHDVPLENWGAWGGVPASEIDIGFKVDV